jgi:transcriptional regulator with XRE-family HTH domain
MATTNEGITVSLGENISKLRNHRGISQVELARRVGTSFPRISEIESGKGNPTVKTLEKIALALSTTPSRLLEENFFSKIG